MRERWMQGWAGVWAGCQARSSAVQAPCPPAVLEPKATEGRTSPLLTQQLFQPQENPSVLTTAHSSRLLCRAGQQIVWSYPLAAHTTAGNALPPGNYFGHGSVGHLPHLNALGESGITHEHVVQGTQRSALGKSAQ